MGERGDVLPRARRRAAADPEPRLERRPLPGERDRPVWPHDNATIAGGFRRYGRSDQAQRVAAGIFAAAERFESHRLPELFAGLERTPESFPVQYLGANVPQAWASAAVFRLVATLCGIHSAGSRRTIYVNPDLPDWLPTITLRNLRAGNGAANLRMEHDRLEVLSNSTGFAIVQGPVPRPTPWSRDPVSR